MTATAFGLDLEPAFEMPGLDSVAADPTGRRVRLALASEEELRSLAGDTDRRRISQASDAGGRAVAAVDAVGGRGFLMWAEGFGSAWVSSDGGELLCAPVEGPAWRWQRFLTGQVLPFAAVLHGLEVFHASAVVLDGRALAVVAGSAAGKTSVGLNLALRGLGFLNDDVLVLEAGEGPRPAAHPGAALANVRRDGTRLPERLEEAGLGRRLGETPEETRIAVRRHGRPVPLGAVFYLERTASGGRATIERLSPVDPRLLLASTFNLALRDPARLARQLDVCGRIADSCAIHRVDCPPAVDATALAGEIHQAALALEPQPS